MDYELMMNGNVKIGQKAPEFDSITSCGPVSLNDYKGKWLVFFSHPGDFTPECNIFKKIKSYKKRHLSIFSYNFCVFNYFIIFINIRTINHSYIFIIIVIYF